MHVKIKLIISLLKQDKQTYVYSVDWLASEVHLKAPFASYNTSPARHSWPTG